MMELTALFSVCVVVLTALALLGVTSWRRRGVPICALFLTLLLLCYVAFSSLLSHAKPTSLEWLRITEAEVLHYSLVEGEGIFLLLQWAAVPGYYRIPWSEERARQLQKAMRQGETHGGVMMRRPFENSLDEAPMFYVRPQPKMPDKPPPGGRVFGPRS